MAIPFSPELLTNLGAGLDNTVIANGGWYYHVMTVHNWYIEGVKILSDFMKIYPKLNDFFCSLSFFLYFMDALLMMNKLLEGMALTECPPSAFLHACLFACLPAC